MTIDAEAPTAVPVAPPRRGAVITALGVTQIMAWGSSYYLPAVLAKPIALDTGWSLTWIVGGLSIGLLAAGLVSPRIGRLIEDRGGRPVLVGSALLLAAGLVGLGVSRSLVTYVGAWIVLGAGMGAGLYDPAFATLGRLYGTDARRAITTLTLFGGFASTVCWPLSAFLAEHFGWRGACLFYAAIQLGFSLPIYLFALPKEQARPPWQDGVARIAVERPHVADPPHRSGFLLIGLLAVAITVSALISTVMSVHMLTILQSRGMSLTDAVGFGALVGPSQVGARFVEMMIARHHHPIWTKLASVAFVLAGMVILWSGAPIIAVGLLLYGAGIGLESIARGTVPLALVGGSGYAALMGRLALPSLVAQAAAPSMGAMLLEGYGPATSLAVLSAAAAGNVILVVVLVAVWAKSREAAVHRS